MDAISLLMFAFPLMFGWVFSLVGMFEFATAVESKKAPVLALILTVISTPLWFINWLFWTASATNQMYVAFGWFWFGMGITNLILFFASVGLLLKFSVHTEMGKLEIGEDNSQR